MRFWLVMLVAWGRCFLCGFRAFWHHLRETQRFPNPVVPKNYHDKMLWRKIFDHSPAYVTMTDKLAARDIAKSRCGELKFTEIVWQGQSIADFPFDTIDLPVIVKRNAGSRDHFVVENRDVTTRKALIDHFEELARKRPYGTAKGEWAYGKVPVRLFAERLLLDDAGRPPDDYKLHFCSGQMVQMLVSHDRWGTPAMVDYDGNLKVMDVDRPGWSRDYTPRNWHRIDDIMRVARRLAGDMDFIRIDLYVHDNDIYFGEFTLYPASGLVGAREINEMRGANWDIRQSLYFRSATGLFRREYLKLLQKQLK